MRGGARLRDAVAARRRPEVPRRLELAAPCQLHGSWTSIVRQLSGSWTSIARRLSGSWTSIARQLGGSWVAVKCELRASCVTAERQLSDSGTHLAPWHMSGLAAPVLQERRAAEVSEAARDPRFHLSQVDAPARLPRQLLQLPGLHHLRLLPAAAFVRRRGAARPRATQAQRDGRGKVGVLRAGRAGRRLCWRIQLDGGEPAVAEAGACGVAEMGVSWRRRRVPVEYALSVS